MCCGVTESWHPSIDSSAECTAPVPADPTVVGSGVPEPMQGEGISLDPTEYSTGQKVGIASGKLG
jgi:hypothetical protein